MSADRADTPGMLFVTGMQRSGTTLMDKLLDRHPQLRVLSQPFPLLFVETKRRFLEERGIDDPMPLTHYMGGLGYTLDDLTEFLDTHEITPHDVDTAFEAMSGYSGQLTPTPDSVRRRVREELRGGCFHDVALQLYRLMGETTHVDYVGGKEVTCEEFVPHLLAHGARTVVMVRDPRDVVTSLNYGDGEKWTGRPKPTLFNIRHWRKSVHITMGSHAAGTYLVSYERLVGGTADELENVARFLDIASFGVDDMTALTDQQGRPWEGNSSFVTDDDTTARYVRILPADLSRYVEAASLPELRLLGYPTDLDVDGAIDTLRSFQEPFPIERPGLAGYSEDPRNVSDEVRRLDALRTGDSFDDRTLFLSVQVAEALAATLN